MHPRDQEALGFRLCIFEVLRRAGRPTEFAEVVDELVAFWGMPDRGAWESFERRIHRALSDLVGLRRIWATTPREGLAPLYMPLHCVRRYRKAHVYTALETAAAVANLRFYGIGVSHREAYMLASGGRSGPQAFRSAS